MDKNRDLYEIKSKTGVIVAVIPVSYVDLYKKVSAKAATKSMYQKQPASSLFVVKTDNEQFIDFLDRDVSLEVVTHIELETNIKIKEESDLERINDHYKRYGFLTVSDYILFYMTKQIEPYVKVCRSCKQYQNGICLTYGYAMCGSNWGCKNFM